MQRNLVSSDFTHKRLLPTFPLLDNLELIQFTLQKRTTIKEFCYIQNWTLAKEQQKHVKKEKQQTLHYKYPSI